MTQLMAKVHQSGLSICLLTLFSMFMYAQDIFQDVFVIISSLSSEEVYSVLFNLKISERSFGYVMATVFVVSVVVVGWDTILKGRKLILVKKYPWIQGLMVLACLFNLGPVFLTLLSLLFYSKRFKSLYVNKR